MSDDAKTLLYWAEGSRSIVADDDYHMECAWNARRWAAHIIGAGC